MSEKKSKGKRTDWWKTPKTQTFLDAEDAVEAAFEELTALEATMHDRITQQMGHRYGENELLVQFLLRREMVKSPEWQAAWQRFTDAVWQAHHATHDFRAEIEETTQKK
ncbi:MAG: hypothetical protein M3347_15625 [Armatimonadota bacterium]|nr:hypothetical protein [Armatimonadota bacterium]